MTRGERDDSRRPSQVGGNPNPNSEIKKQFGFKTMAPARGRIKLKLFGLFQSIQMDAARVCLLLTLVIVVAVALTSVGAEERSSRQINTRPGSAATNGPDDESNRRRHRRAPASLYATTAAEDEVETEVYTTPAISDRFQWADAASDSSSSSSQLTNKFVASLEKYIPPNSDDFDDSPMLTIPPSDSSNETCYEYENIVRGRPSPGASYCFMVAYGLIFLLGLSGNLLTLYVLNSKGSRCSAQDILLGYLAISDVMLCVFAIPITPKYLVWDHYWKMGQILCKLVSATQCVSVYMSTYSLIVIGYIRYRLIVHPLGEAMSKRRSINYCLGTSIVACGFTYLYVRKIRVFPDNCEIKFCDEEWQGNDRFYFSLFTCSCQLSIPLVAVIFFYFKIYRRLDHRITGGGGGGGGGGGSTVSVSGGSKKATSGGAGSQKFESDGLEKASQSQANNQNARSVLEIRQSRQRERERRMRRMNKRLIWVVCIFAFSWFPLNLYNLLSDYSESLASWPYITYAFLVTHLIACSSVVWNPFLYAWMSDSFKDDLRRATPQCLRTSRWFKVCLNESSTASGLHGGAGLGGYGSPTSIVMVSTNGHHLHHQQQQQHQHQHQHQQVAANSGLKGLRVAGFGRDAFNNGGAAAAAVAGLGAQTGFKPNPNGLTEASAPNGGAAEESLQNRLSDQIADIRSNEPVAETQLTLYCSDQLEPDGQRKRSTKSLDETGSSQEELYGQDEELCRCLEDEEEELKGQPAASDRQYFIEICEERPADRRHLSGAESGNFDEISNRPASIKLSRANETNTNTGLTSHWARA